MAPKQKTAPAPPELDPVNEAAIDEDEDARISEIFAELGQAQGDVTWEVSVYRITGPERLRFKQPWLFDCDVSEVRGIRHRLGEQYGNGNYRVKVIRNNQLYKVFDIGIELPVGRAVAVKDDAPKSELMLLIEEMREDRRAMAEELRALRAAPAPVAVSPVSQLKELAETMGALQALQPKPAPAPDVLGVFRDVMELVKDMPQGGGGDGPAGWVGLIDSVLKSPAIAAIGAALIPGAAAALAGGGGQQQHAPALSPRTEPHNAPAITIAPSAPQTPWAGAMTQAVNYLIARAALGADPRLESNWVYDNLPPVAIEYLGAQPDAIAALANFDPRVREHAQWFAALLDAMAASDEAEAPPPPGPSTNGAKPANIPSGNT